MSCDRFYVVKSNFPFPECRSGNPTKEKKSQDSPELAVSKFHSKRHVKNSKKTAKDKETMSQVNINMTQSQQQQSVSLLPQCLSRMPPYPGTGPHEGYYTPASHPPSQFNSSQIQYQSQTLMPQSLQQPYYNFQQLVLDKL